MIFHVLGRPLIRSCQDSIASHATWRTFRHQRRMLCWIGDLNCMVCSIRRLSREEADQVTLIYREAFDERLPWLAGFHTPGEDRAFFRTRVFMECQVWGAIDEAIIGFIAFRAGWIDQLHVLPHRQRQGAGRALLQVAKATSASLMLWTFQRNMPARLFYESQGFFAVKETDGSGNEEREPDVLYRWQQTAARPIDVPE